MRWKTKFGRCLYTSPSGYKVYQNFFYRWLTLGSEALQTVINRHQPQKPVLYYLSALSLMARQFPGDTCLLGLGGAGVIQMLAPKLDQYLLTAVDNSEEVIQIAKEFFMADSFLGLNIVQKNALDYLRECKTPYKHLLIDLYDSQQFPTECNNEEFFFNAKNSVQKDGFIAVNLANYKEQWCIFNLIKKQFSHTFLIPIKKSANLVVIASSSDNSRLLLEHIKYCSEIKQIGWVNLWGKVGEIKITY